MIRLASLRTVRQLRGPRYGPADSVDGFSAPANLPIKGIPGPDTYAIFRTG